MSSSRWSRITVSSIALLCMILARTHAPSSFVWQRGRDGSARSQIERTKETTEPARSHRGGGRSPLLSLLVLRSVYHREGHRVSHQLTCPRPWQPARCRRSLQHTSLGELSDIVEGAHCRRSRHPGSNAKRRQQREKMMHIDTRLSQFVHHPGASADAGPISQVLWFNRSELFIKLFPWP